jgi:hypothetical protein
MHSRFVVATIVSLSLVASFVIYPELSQAETVNVTGAPGTPGVPGVNGNPPGNGGNGGAATATAGLDASNTANATGGAGEPTARSGRVLSGSRA